MYLYYVMVSINRDLYIWPTMVKSIIFSCFPYILHRKWFIITFFILPTCSNPQRKGSPLLPGGYPEILALAIFLKLNWGTEHVSWICASDRNYRFFISAETPVTLVNSVSQHMFVLRIYQGPLYGKLLLLGAVQKLCNADFCHF